MIGVLIASTFISGVPCSLVAWRSAVGLGPTWGICRVDGLTRTDLVDGSTTAPSPYPSPNYANGWIGTGESRLLVSRVGDTISVKCSQFGSSELDDDTLLTYTLPPGSPFAGKQSIGYAAQSQADATYSDITFSYVSDVSASVFSVAKSYDHIVATFRERDNMLLPEAVTPEIGDRVLVTGDTLTDGFWTIWRYNGTSFDLTRYQTYRTTDFWALADWYASGYSPTSPPVVRYANAGARDVAETNNPRTTFVRIDDDGFVHEDGSVSWAWTSFIDGRWVVVARQNGTIQLSPTLYAAGRPDIGIDPISPDDLYDPTTLQTRVPMRDGGWEIRALMATMRDYNCLTDLEINELFFSILHFCHAQQDEVTWAFKTSFLNIGGYNEALRAVPVQPIDNTQNLLNYVNEVKPYRVKTREFTRVVTPDIDYANVQMTDFDFPPYIDPITNQRRILRLDSPEDLDIISTQRPWKDWYENYQGGEWRPEYYDAATWNPVRHFNITMLFDRVDHMPIISTTRFVADGSTNQFIPDEYFLANASIVEVMVDEVEISPLTGFGVSGQTITLVITPAVNSQIVINIREPLTIDLAADRLEKYYDPTNSDSPEKNLRRLMGLEFKGDQFDGGDMEGSGYDYELNSSGGADLDNDEFINPDSAYFGLSDPLHASNRPEELAAVRVGEGLSMHVTSSTEDFMVSMSRSAMELSLPQMVGDYDARPLNTINYDIGQTQKFEDTQAHMIHPLSTQDSNISPGTSTDASFYTPAGVPRGIEVLRPDAYEYLNTSTFVTLQSLVMDNSTVITVSNAAALQGPTTHILTNDDGDHKEIIEPGVIFINGERIEFFEVDGNDLKQLRRGTHNTRIGAELFVRRSFSGTGTLQVFTMTGETSPSGLIVAVYEVLRSPSGAILTYDQYTGYRTLAPKTSGVDYIVSVAGGNLVVTFVKPPPAGSTVYLTKSLGAFHAISSKVYDGRKTIDPLSS
jgi:hypothetical protein